MPSVTRKASGARPRREALEADVFRALEKLLADGASFTELGVQQIATEAGIGRSTFYTQFSDKSDLLIRFAAESTRELFAVAAEWTTSLDVADLEATLLAVIRERRANAPTLRAVAEVAAYDPEVERAWHAMVGSNIDLIRERIERDQEAGRTAKDVDAALTAAYVTWGTERWVGRHVDSGDPTPDEAVAATMARVIWLAMYGRFERQIG